MISRKFITSTLLYTVSSSLTTIASFVLLPFYTNTRLLTVSDYGALALFIGLSLLVQVIATFSIDFYVAIVYHEFKDDPIKLKGKIASLNGFMLLAGLALLIFFVAGGNFFIKEYVPNPNPASFRYVIMSVLTGIFNAHFRFYNGLLINQEKSWRYFSSNMLNFVTTILFSLIILRLFPLTLEGPLWGRLLSGACIFAMSFIDITRVYGIAFKREILKPLAQFCFPLFVTSIFQWILSYSYGYIIKPLLFNEQVAIFDLAVKFTMLITFIIEGIGAAMTVKIFILLKQEQTPAIQKEINKYYSSLNLMSLFIIPATIFILPIVVPIFISSEKYLVTFMYFGLVGAGILTRTVQILFINPTHFFKQTIKLTWVNGIAAAVQLGLSYMLIKYFKLYGAAFALNIVKVFQVLLYYWFCRTLVTPGINVRKMFVLPMISLIIITVGEMFINGYGIRMHAIHFLEMVAIGLLAWGFYRTELLELWRWGLRKLQVKSIFS